jgi:hypothetical protein
MPTAKPNAKPARAATTGLAVHPGERKPLAPKSAAAVDEKLVRQAVLDINAIHSAKGLETARAMGEYVLSKFFGGDLDYAQKSHTKHLSFAALADHSELNVGKSTLWYAVAMLGQLRQLPKDIAGALPFSHHKLLLSVKDPEQKLELAKEAVATGISKRKLEDRVRGVRGERWTGAGKPGRQALPPWAKGIGTIKKAVESAMARGVTIGEVVVQGPEKVEDRLAEIAAAIELLEGFRASLTAALAEAKVADRLADGIVAVP